MIGSQRFDPRRYSSVTLFVIGLVALGLFVTSFVVEVRILVESPNLGDVTELVRVLWQGLLALATVGSFLVALRNRRSDETPADGPARTFEIRGENHDIDFHLHVSDLSEPRNSSGAVIQNRKDYRTPKMTRTAGTARRSDPVTSPALSRSTLGQRLSASRSRN